MNERLRDDAVVVDFGAHFFPRKPPENKTVHDFIEEQQGIAVHKNIDGVRERYDRSGVDAVTLSREDIIGSGQYDEVRKENDHMREIAREHEDVYSLAAIPTEAGGDQAAAELERCIENGHNGGVIQTKSGGIELHHDEVTPILEVADELGVPLLVHPKVHNSLHADALDDDWRLNAVFGREISVCESIIKVVNSGVLDRYSDLDLVFHHLGGNIASMLGRMRGDTMADRWPGADRLKPYDEFREQLAERIFIDTSGFYGDPTAFRAALQVFPSSNILFGTDFPYETRSEADFERIISTIEQLCPYPDARDILGRNAVDLLVNV
jgi:predicted TIM-barrel fold metal-dependent hydrolase